MIARWMLAAMLFALLAGIAALAADRALRAMQRPQRFPWLAALVVAITWPCLAPLVAWLTPAPVAEVVPLAVSVSAPLAIAATAGWAEHLDGLLVGVWAVLSCALALQVVIALRVLRRARGHSRPMQIDGETVLVAQSLGPAVVGVLSPRIVVPEWLLELDAPLRALVIRHEREHCRARDTVLVWLGVTATVLMPWNPAVWWIARRLRLAMEIDCDARTLHGGAGQVGYAKLLLLIAQRQSTVRFVPMLAESSSHLGRRISAMRSRPLSPSVLSAVALGAVACVAVAVACSPRIASNLTGPVPAASPNAASVAASDAAPAATSKPFVEFQLRKSAVMAPGTPRPEYPAELRAAGVEGGIVVQFVVNADGSIDASTLKVLKSDHPAFVTAVRAALPSMRYLPAEVDGRKLRQLIELPIQFSLSGSNAIVNMQPSRMPTGAPPAGAARTNAVSPTPSPQRAGAVNDGTQPYFDFQTTRPATMTPGSAGPQYPASLREARVEGGVLAQFVVDETGRVDMSTFKVLKSDHPEFADAVKQTVATTLFTPADLQGKAVKQLVQVPFQFSLSR
jgi:TonB family protein